MDKSRIEKYLAQISGRDRYRPKLLQRPDDEILSTLRELKSLEVFRDRDFRTPWPGVLQHILAKKHNVAVSGYTEIFLRAG